MGNHFTKLPKEHRFLKLTTRRTKGSSLQTGMNTANKAHAH